MAKKIKKNRKEEIEKISKKLNLSDYEYVADDETLIETTEKLKRAFLLRKKRKKSQRLLPGIEK